MSNVGNIGAIQDQTVRTVVDSLQRRINTLENLLQTVVKNNSLKISHADLDDLPTLSAGNGLQGGGKFSSGTITLNVGAGTGISVDASNVNVDETADFSWTGAHDFATNVVRSDVGYSGQIGSNKPLYLSSDADDVGGGFPVAVDAVVIARNSGATASRTLTSFRTGGIGGTEQAYITPAGAIVAGAASAGGFMWCRELRAGGDVGGQAGANTLTNGNPALGGGAAATLGTIGGSGPAAAAQASWIKIYIGTTAHWIPVWQ